MLTLYHCVPGKRSPLAVFANLSNPQHSPNSLLQPTKCYNADLSATLRQAHFPELLHEPGTVVIPQIASQMPPEDGYQELDVEEDKNQR